MAELILSRPNSTSPPPNCAICLGSSSDKCISDVCLHEFCFKCLFEWSKIKAECPLCKKTFKSIRHNFKSVDEYDEYFVEYRPIEDLDHEIPRLLDPEYTERQFHFRTTFTVDTGGEHAIQQMLHSHQLINRVSISGFTLDRQGLPLYFSGDPVNGDAQRSAYSDDAMWLQNRYFRNISPAEFRTNRIKNQIEFWLEQELRILMSHNPRAITFISYQIQNYVMLQSITHPNFIDFIRQLFQDRAVADRFIPEFYNFVYNLINSDMTASDVCLDISDCDEDSDVMIVGESTNSNPEVIDLLDTDSDEPIFVDEEVKPSTQVCQEDRSRTPILPLKLRLKKKHHTKQWTCEMRHRSPSSSSSEDMYDYEQHSFRKFKRKRKTSKKSRERRHRKSKMHRSEDCLNSNDHHLSRMSSICKEQLKRYSKQHPHRSHTITSKECPESSLSHETLESIRTNAIPITLTSPLNLIVEKPTKTANNSFMMYSQKAKPKRHSKSHSESKNRSHTITSRAIAESSESTDMLQSYNQTMLPPSLRASPLNLIVGKPIFNTIPSSSGNQIETPKSNSSYLKYPPRNTSEGFHPPSVSSCSRIASFPDYRETISNGCYTYLPQASYSTQTDAQFSCAGIPSFHCGSMPTVRDESIVLKNELLDAKTKERTRNIDQSHACSSGGRLRNLIIRKESSSNSWYSRPLTNDSDSSD